MIQISIKNYRCFVAPAVVEFDSGNFTAFVGVNNAGKSAFIRFLVEFRQLFEFLKQANLLEAMLVPGGARNLAVHHVFDPEEAFSNLNDGAIEIKMSFSGEHLSSATDVVSQALIVINRNPTVTCSMKIDTRDLGRVDFSRGLSWRTPTTLLVGSHLIDFEHLMNLAEKLHNTLYIGPFRNIINVGANVGYFDIQIGDAFVSQFRDLKTGASKKNSAGMQRLIEDVRRIFEFESLAIEPSSDNKSLHITINGKPFKQHELGSGLSQFIVVLANAAIRRPSLILIDEPELNLHPRLQLDFLTALGSYATDGVWFSTHSLGLARSAAERVYSIQRVSDGNSLVTLLEGTPRGAEFLGELSFSTQRELGADQILLVEGPTEVKVIQQLLRRIRKDHLVVLMSMHGHLPDAVELDEILRITPRVAALIDSEKDSAQAELEPKRRFFAEMFEAKSLRVHVLERRATENYFTDNAVKQVFGESFRALGPYEKLKDATPHWGKNQNWLLALPSAEAIDQTDLGQFLSAL
ncbi:ATP-dependent nuclease [Bradyrhizobium liaoningense]|uniref:ATP-dependent nuclease n=1 Tax=Bradyrhizobium liaoningense TaxID=43992 RepID=UPI001BAA1CBC|nr:AAA family ATPase [Bradyrhizobium liaoningense]MBR1170417.1 AAA family ATPase [Bradyrhizobium liaoningense]